MVRRCVFAISIFSSLVLLLSTQPLIANQSLAPVVVTPTRTPHSLVTLPATITIITEEQIKHSGVTHVADLLRNQASIQLRDLFGDGSRTTISMRGFAGGNAAANTLVLVDGRRLNNIDLSAPDLNSISLKDVKQIEIIQGSAGTLYGDQAVGGVINIITHTPQAFASQLSPSAGNFDTQKLAASISDKLGATLRYRVSVEDRHTDNYRRRNQQDYLNGQTRVDYGVDTHSVFAELQSIDEYLELPGDLSAAQIATDPRQVNGTYPNQFNDTKTNIGRVGGAVKLTPQWKSEMEFTQRYTTISGIAFNDAMNQLRKHKSLTPRLIGSVATAHGDALLTIGIDYEDNRYQFRSASSFVSTIDSKQTGQAVYAQSVWPLSTSLTATLGTRYAEVDSFIIDSQYHPNSINLRDDVWVTELGLSWRMDQHWRLFARRDENYRFAKIDEQTYTSPGVVGLDTQTGVSYEIGSEWNRDKHRVKLLVYRLDLDNEIDFDSTASAPSIFPGANVNLPPTRRTGIVLENKWQVLPSWSITGQYSYIDAKFSAGSFTGKAIPFVADNNLRITSDYRFNDHWSSWLEAHYTGSRFQDSDYANTSAPLPGYTVYNLHLRYTAKPYEWSLRADNVTGKKYNAYATFNSFYPAPTQRYLLSLKLDF